METFIALCGFAGAWLLVAGPIYQAALELRDEDLARDRIREIAHSISPPPSISVWWWLLPPVKFLLEKRRSDEYRKQHFAALSAEDSEALIAYMNKATAWLMVGMGGLLLATKETYELIEILELRSWIVFPAVLAMVYISVSYTIVRIQRAAKILREK